MTFLDYYQRKYGKRLSKILEVSTNRKNFNAELTEIFLSVYAQVCVKQHM